MSLLPRLHMLTAVLIFSLRLTAGWRIASPQRSMPKFMHPSLYAPPRVATDVASRCAHPLMMSSAAVQTLCQIPGQLFPNTLGKFWGLHALIWTAASTISFVLARHCLLLIPLAAANAALAMMIYRSREDLGAGVAAAAGVYFSGHTAVLFLLPGVMHAANIASFLPCLCAWHAAMAVGYSAFAIKASLKDRLFGNVDDGSVLRTTAAGTVGTCMPSLFFLNRQSGAKIADRVEAFLNTVAAEASNVCDALYGLP